MKLAAIGDIHLSASSPRRDHTLEVLDWTIADARARGATHWVLTGDTNEGAATPEENRLLMSRVAMMAAPDDKAISFLGVYPKLVAIVEGNHEEQGSFEWLPLVAGYVTVASTRFMEWHDREAIVLFIPYPHRNRPPYDNLDDDGTIKGSMAAAARRIQERVALTAAARDQAEPGVPLLVFGHFTIESMTTRDTEFEQHRADEVVVPVTAFAGAQLVAVGHIHKQQDINVTAAMLPHLKTGDVDDWIKKMMPRIVGIGGLVRHSRAEAEDPKSYLMTTVGADHSVEIERIPVPARGIVTRKIIAVNGILDEAEMAEIEAAAVGQELSLTVEVTSDHASQIDQRAIEQRLRESAASVSVERHTIAVERARAPELAVELKPEDELRAYLRATGQEIDEARFARLAEKLATIPV